MKPEERKERLVALLNELLEECGGLKKKLAQKLGIDPSTLTPWLQGKIDPASLDLVVFMRMAEVALRSTDELAQLLGLVENSEDLTLERFKNLVEYLLSSQSQKQLGKKLGVSHTTVSSWISSQTAIDPRRIPMGTIVALAIERGWTIEGLLAYLGLKKTDEIREDLLLEVQTLAAQLPLLSQVKFITWFFREFENRLENLDIRKQGKSDKKNLIDKKVCIVLEKEDFSLASNYLREIGIHTRLQLENISIATATKIPESLSDFDVLVVDVASDESPCLSLIEQIEFDGALVAFADSGLSEAIRDRLLSLLTDLLIKPIPWNELKDKPYFQ